ncbi:MAG: UvrD-helicase domain-containing protein [Chloracidobacterium sp.]|nr:UvrD-helicase domain-containing protein [Chloracidobacterium sp.]
MNEFAAIEDAEAVLGSFAGGKWQKSQTVVGCVSKLAEECLDPDVLIKSTGSQDPRHGTVLQTLPGKTSRRELSGFFVIQSEMLHLIENRPEILGKLQDKLQYLMIDEYQDTNTIQKRLYSCWPTNINVSVLSATTIKRLYHFEVPRSETFSNFRKTLLRSARRRS